MIKPGRLVVVVIVVASDVWGAQEAVNSERGTVERGNVYLSSRELVLR